MCSSILNILYIVALVGGAGMTLVSLVTPAWRSTIANSTCTGFNCITVANNDYKQTVGLLCTSKTSCENYFNSQPTYQKVVLATMILALLFCAAAFVWSCVACFVCCCKSCLTPPLPILSGLACICDIIGIAVYGVKSGKDFNITNVPTSYNSLNSSNDFGYSMWVGIGACVVLFIDTIIGIVLAKVSKVMPI